MKGTLYIVGTPIGNLSDITLRALETLKTVDVIACEDTRRTLAMLNKYEIKKPLVSYYKQKEKEGAVKIAELLDEGKRVALVTDAGMPCISDPGSVLVDYLRNNDYPYTVVPGPTAVTSAAALVGTEKGFTFVGFLPEKNKQKKQVLESVKSLPHTVFFYAAPHDVNDVLELLNETLGDREVFVVKEITKIYETVTQGTLSSLRIENPKGEFVIGVQPEKITEEKTSDEDIIEELKSLINSGKDKKTAIKETTEKFGISKNTVYKLSLNI